MHSSGTVSQSIPAYAGDISPQDAWDVLQAEERAILVDVRTPAEWGFVGEPDLSKIHKKPFFISWRLFPTMEVNTSFEEQLVDALPDIGKDTNIYFLCRSGSRSRDAAVAMTALGYKHCYNVEGGFEGDINSQQHRGKTNGWKSTQLPWKQR